MPGETTAGGVAWSIGAPGSRCGLVSVSLDWTLTQLHSLVLLGEQWTACHGPKAGVASHLPGLTVR